MLDSDADQNLGMRKFLAKETPPAELSRFAANRRLEREIRDSFSLRRILGNRVFVKADGGVVTLRGSLRDEEERCLAVETVASVSGVSEVVDELILGDRSQVGSSSALVATIYVRLLSKANVGLEAVSIEDQSGVILVKGVVDNPVRKLLIETLILETKGVSSLKNELRVDPLAIGETATESVDDASITGMVRSALKSAGLHAEIRIYNGLIVLSGVAADLAERSMIGAIAQSFRGVRWVTNEMSVRRGELPYA
ncbi:BON domain-containing protein [Pelagicoccus sp. SDUM812003]|uniref:BON domain-containing protein n=1 Tax=Pelagicoccus sp. SDUM812003 TaxID=3041267 RepID=UPI00280C4A8D|nr:BON domain-containing protein [Pelagicoccus sp. SDUM812003]MDQ8204310.1 BON domain-containing protein [Pelagicoccus sp. SDUM812003]